MAAPATEHITTNISGALQKLAANKMADIWSLLTALVSITSLGAWLRNFPETTRSGIGLRRDSDGKFSRWDNEEPLTYTKWSRNEPNNLFNDEDCAEMFRYSGSWLDTTCKGRFARKHPFICEMSEF